MTDTTKKGADAPPGLDQLKTIGGLIAEAHDELKRGSSWLDVLQKVARALLALLLDLVQRVGPIAVEILAGVLIGKLRAAA